MPVINSNFLSKLELYRKIFTNIYTYIKHFKQIPNSSLFNGHKLKDGNNKCNMPYL
jgi:hypothetical protein